MEVINSGVVERRQPMRRNDSFSTIGSSAAAEIMQQVQIMQGSSDESRYVAAIKGQAASSNNQTSMIIQNSEGVHVGDIIYNYYQNPIENISVHSPKSVDRASAHSSSVSDHFSKPKKIYQSRNRKRNILITVFLIIVLIIVSITVPVIYLNKPNNKTDETTTESNSPPSPEFLISREEWGANPPRTVIQKLSLPIKRVIIAHTGGISCSSEYDCKAVVKAIQTNNSHLNDIPYNFLVGGDGKVYEGRGLEYEGQHTSNKDATDYNSIGICIALIGNYQTKAPSDSQLKILEDFIEYYVTFARIDEDYIVVSQDDLVYSNLKANALNEAVKNLTNFYQLQKVYRREEWEAAASTHAGDPFYKIMDWVMLSHTVTEKCTSLGYCAELMRRMQRTNIEDNKYYDYAFSFAIGGDGFVFEGRGWDRMGAHMGAYFNARTIGIIAIGDYESIEPSTEMLYSLQRLMDDAVVLGKLTSSYQVNGRQDFGSVGPGEAFMRHVREWCRYGNRTTVC